MDEKLTAEALKQVTGGENKEPAFYMIGDGEKFICSKCNVVMDKISQTDNYSVYRCSKCGLTI